LQPIEYHAHRRCGHYRFTGTGAAVLGMLLILLSGCAPVAQPPVAHEMLNATLWQQASAEHEAIALQVYQLARGNLDLALAEPQWNAMPEAAANSAHLPPAIILDLDETVLDNSAYEVRIIKHLGQFSPESFADWCREARAAAVPGVLDFLAYASGRGVAVFYYSARKESLRDCTTRNLQALQLPLADASHLLLNDGRSKSDYRAMIARDYRILLLLGDNLEDFMDGSRGAPDIRRGLAQNHAQYWGREWILLPNPIYGHWESSCYDFDYRLPREDRLHRKLQQLRD
jgi:acid phosphatase